ncbi:MAG: hypothetical protein M1497_13580 [Nitrospirae bacterium]|nr:hypothetical protein [Nitrospirota bacterium]
MEFLVTGRFEEITEIYNALYSEALNGRFREEAAAMIQYSFTSEAFTCEARRGVQALGKT